MVTVLTPVSSPPSGSFKMATLQVQGQKICDNNNKKSYIQDDVWGTNMVYLTLQISLRCRVQMSNLSSFLTTSFHTQLSFLDADSEEDLLEEEEEEEEESFGPSGIHNYLHIAALEIYVYITCWKPVLRPD